MLSVLLVDLEWYYVLSGGIVFISEHGSFSRDKSNNSPEFTQNTHRIPTITPRAVMPEEQYQGPVPVPVPSLILITDRGSAISAVRNELE